MIVDVGDEEYGMSSRALADRLRLARNLVDWSFYSWFYAMLAGVSVHLVMELLGNASFSSYPFQDVMELTATFIGTMCALSALRITTRIVGGHDISGMESKALRCGHCGSVIMDGDRTCSECGGGIHDAMASKDWFRMKGVHQCAVVSLATLTIVQVVSLLLLLTGWAGDDISSERALQLAGMSTWALLPSYFAARWITPWLHERRLK